MAVRVSLAERTLLCSEWEGGDSRGHSRIGKIRQQNQTDLGSDSGFVTYHLSDLEESSKPQ